MQQTINDVIKGVDYYGWEEGFFHHGEKRDVSTPGLGIEYRRGMAILAMKKELDDRGFNDPVMKFDLPYYGDTMLTNMKKFQQAVGLTPDGVVGYYTTYALFWCGYVFENAARLVEVQVEKGIPNNYLAKLLSLESGYYPAAANSDGDVGLAQIHNPADISEALDPAYSVNWAADRLLANHHIMEQIPGSWTKRWWAALWAHNAPSLADDWLRAGCPTSGGPMIDVGGEQKDAWAWATLYVNLVLKQKCL